ncbi:hypothetical protein [Nocardia sp. NPDC052112]|uniref:hypothetical protein n=1 Tax=Nocardia sp. NPDC052112 TaxID=3155646 RepID=UPI0034231072
MILRDGSAQPVHDLLSRDGLTLLTADPHGWTEATRDHDNPIPLPLQVIGLISRPPSTSSH